LLQLYYVYNREIYIQSTVHIGTKVRTRYFKPNIVFPMGTYLASVDHLMELTRSHTKDKHLLTMTDLKPEDKMNFQSAQKMCTTKVLEILSQLPGIFNYYYYFFFLMP